MIFLCKQFHKKVSEIIITEKVKTFIKILYLML